MNVAVGSQNPVKVRAVETAFHVVFPDQEWSIEPVAVTSDVADQPMSFTESIQGARTRAQKAIKALHADYGIGLEGGIQKIDNKWFDSGWIVIVDKNGIEGIGSSIAMEVPKKMITMIQQGTELGMVVDTFFKTQKSKSDIGHFGLMTNSIITREHCYRDGVISALARFMNPQVF